MPIGTLTASFALPLVGRQIDRRGPRMMVGVIAALFALACVYMGLVQNAVMLDIARDLLGSYTVALTPSALLPLALSVVALFTRRPRRATVRTMVTQG